VISNEPAVEDIHRSGKRPGARRGLRGLLVLFALIGLLLAGAIVAGLLPRLTRDKALLADSSSHNDRLPQVTVATVRRAPKESSVELPGDLVALIESPIFARVDGYIKSRSADIGYRVKKDQVLMELDTPDLDQQLSQSRAQLAQSKSALKQMDAALGQAQANLRLAQVTVDRWKQLVAGGVVSRQDSDEKQATYDVGVAQVESARANVAAAKDAVSASEANVRRLEELKSYARVTAPFDGIITFRNPDIGTLINAGSAGAGREMFRLAQIHILRIFVNVPQAYSTTIQKDQRAELRVQELPGRVFPVKVKETTHSLDANSRTLLAVLVVENPDGLLLPGMYAQVKFFMQQDKPALLVPGDALVMGTTGPRVAVVDADHRVHYRPIQIVRDYGSELEVHTGLNPGDQLVVNPGDEIRENTKVEVRTPAK
jgi:RND family efflux transporter MFP subunit